MKKANVRNIVFLFLLLFTFTGCSDSLDVPYESVDFEMVIPDDKKKEASEYLIRLVRAANPLSDEEPEDNIRQAEITTANMFGKRTIGISAYQNGMLTFIPYNECNVRQKQMCDTYLGGE